MTAAYLSFTTVATTNSKKNDLDTRQQAALDALNRYSICYQTAIAYRAEKKSEAAAATV